MSERTKLGFSAGPWELDIEDESVHSSGAMVCSINYHKSVNTMHRTGQTFSHADGYLIAAAPDLHSACERVAAALIASSHSEKYVSEDDWNPDAHVEIVLTIADARAVYAALAKAEGKVTE